MKAMFASQNRYERYSPGLEETEFALAISPCPRIEESKDIRENAQCARQRGGTVRCGRAQRSRDAVFDDNQLTESLSIGWAIALAIAVAVVIHVSGA